MKKLIVGIAVLIIGLVLFFVIMNNKIEQPERPENVPTSAVWDGGVDGGNWIACNNVDSTNNLFFCKVYEDYSGKMIYQGKMKLEGEITSEKKLIKLLGIYSGNEIYLKDKRKLIAITSIDSLEYDEIIK